MMNQSLDQNEILDIRWAHDDPNPVAQDAIDRANRDALFALMQAKGFSLFLFIYFSSINFLSITFLINKNRY